MPAAPTRRRGVMAGLAAYVLWGCFPPFFLLLLPATPLEILSHRILWSFVLVSALLVVLGNRWGWLREGVFRRDRLPRLGAAALLISLNWLVYIWAVNNSHVVEASVGYFINPLVTLFLGVLIFGERLGLGGRIGGSLALVGVVVLSWQHLGTLWISIVLSLSFGFYSVVKKSSHLTGLQGLFVESGLLLVPAVGYLVSLIAAGASHFGQQPALSGLLAISGVVTVLPLWLFAIAAPRLPLGLLGIMQYITPTMQFLTGVLVYREPVSLSYWIGLVLIWVGSAIYLMVNFGPNATREAAPTPVQSDR